MIESDVLFHNYKIIAPVLSPGQFILAMEQQALLTIADGRHSCFADTEIFQIFFCTQCTSLSPRAILYSLVPRGSQLPSILMFSTGILFQKIRVYLDAGYLIIARISEPSKVKIDRQHAVRRASLQKYQ
jgi:hypothetical protein